MPSRRKHRLDLSLTCALALIVALQMGVCTADQSVLYLVDSDPNTSRFSVPTAQTVCTEPNLVVITHGWYERQPWPGWMAQAISQKIDRRQWRCGWYDWRPQALRWRPSESATIGRDTVGPQLGKEIVRLSRDWRHIHLIGHSAGSWVVNAAAEIIAAEANADVHITFLDAYVPDGWNEEILGSLARRSPARCWAEHYFTRDPLNLTENVLTHAHNVDITAINPGFRGHKFPWHWYHATIVGRYAPGQRFAGEPLICRSGRVTYGFARARESGEKAWRQKGARTLGNEPVRITPRSAEREAQTR